MRYLGDFKAGVTTYFMFNTFNPSTQAPITLAGSPTIQVHKANNTTQVTTGLTLTVDYDGITGLHLVTVNMTNAFYAAGNDFFVTLSAGTVGGVSVVGTILGHFSIENRKDNADNLLDWANGIETDVTLRQGLRLILAALAGKVSGAATTTMTFRDVNDTTDRIVATVDADGNRSAVTLDGD